MNCDEPRLLKASSAVRAPVPSIFAENDKRKKDLCQVPGAPNVNVNVTQRFRMYNFRNICSTISWLPASPRIFEHLKMV